MGFQFFWEGLLGQFVLGTQFTEFRFGIRVKLDASDVALGDHVAYGRMHNVTEFLVCFTDCPLHRCHIGIINNGGSFAGSTWYKPLACGIVVTMWPATLLMVHMPDRKSVV